MGSKFGIGSLSIVMSLLLSLAPTFEAELTMVEQATKSDGSISFLVIGDWGRRGLYNQSKVALQMGRIGEKMDIDFVVSTGDNIYDNGMKSIDDPAFQLSFTNILLNKEDFTESLAHPVCIFIGQERGTLLLCDNSSAIKLSKNLVLHGRSKHIHVRYHFLRDLVNDEVIRMEFCSTRDQISDMMTKPVKLDVFEGLRKRLGVCLKED